MRLCVLFKERRISLGDVSDNKKGLLWILEEEALKPSSNELLLVERISTYNGNFFGKFFTLHGMVIF